MVYTSNTHINIQCMQRIKPKTRVEKHINRDFKPCLGGLLFKNFKSISTSSIQTGPAPRALTLKKPKLNVNFMKF
jgi:hypothetical protein